MTAEEYGREERLALCGLRRLHDIGIAGNNIAFVMSEDVYLAALDFAALSRSNSIRLVEGSTDLRDYNLDRRFVYKGYDIFIINEKTYSVFRPAIKGFNIEGVDYERLSFADLVLSETTGGGIRIFYKVQEGAMAVFSETGLTVNLNDRTTLYDRLRAGLEHEMDKCIENQFMTDSCSQSRDFWDGATSTEEIERMFKELDDIALGIRQKQDDKWDEKVTTEGTKELDEFLNSFVIRGAQESKT